MYGLYGVQDLVSQPEGGGEGEGAARLGAPQLGQVPPLQLHHHVVEAVVPAAADEAAHVVLAWGRRKAGLGVGRDWVSDVTEEVGSEASGSKYRPIRLLVLW